MFSAFCMPRYRKNSIRALEAAQNNLPHPRTHQRPACMQIITRDLRPDGLTTPRPSPVSRAADSLEGLQTQQHPFVDLFRSVMASSNSPVPPTEQRLPRWAPSHDPLPEHAHDTHAAERYDDLDARLVAQSAVMEILQSDVSDIREKLLHTEGCVRGRSGSIAGIEEECALSERLGELETLLENHIRSDQELRRTVHELWKAAEAQRRDQEKAHDQLLQRGSLLWLGTVGAALVAQVFVGL